MYEEEAIKATIEDFDVGSSNREHSSGPNGDRQNIVFVASEVAPWSKTGGLGDVMGSLPAALARRGHRVMVIAPRYGPYQDAIDTEVGNDTLPLPFLRFLVALSPLPLLISMGKLELRWETVL